MAEVTIDFRANQAGLLGVLRGPAGAVGSHMRELAHLVRDRADDIAPVDGSGTVRPGNHVTIKGNHDVGEYRQRSRGPTISVINRSGHARAVHEGTTGPIRPTRSKLLFWEDSNGIQKRVAVAGQEANPWIEDAYDDVSRSLPWLDVISEFD